MSLNTSAVGSQKSGERIQNILGYIAALLVLFGSWALISWLINSPALPMPVPALKAFFQQFSEMLPHILISLYRIIVAMILGTALGMPVGLLLGRSKIADSFAAPLIYLTYPIPKIVFLPVLLVLLGLGDAPKIVLIAVVMFFQTLVTTRDAARSIPEQSIDSVRSLGANKFQIAYHVIVPATLPDVFTALRINTGTAIAVIFFAESIAGTTGIGFYINQAWARIDYLSMFAGIIAMALLGVVLYEVLNLFEHRFARWNK